MKTALRAVGLLALGFGCACCSRLQPPQRADCGAGLDWVDRIEGELAVICGAAGCTDTAAMDLQEGDVLCGARASPVERAAQVARVRAAHGRLLRSSGADEAADDQW